MVRMVRSSALVLSLIHILLDKATIVFNRYPIFGSVNYRGELADLGMKQGEGIVDVVNSYLDVVLYYGLVGLFIYLSFFFIVLIDILKGMKKCRYRSTEAYNIGRSLLSCLIGILITIFTVSSIMVIPIVYWLIAGIAVSYYRIAQNIITKKQDDGILPTYRYAINHDAIKMI